MNSFRIPEQQPADLTSFATPDVDTLKYGFSTIHTVNMSLQPDYFPAKATPDTSTETKYSYLAMRVQSLVANGLDRLVMWDHAQAMTHVPAGLENISLTHRHEMYTNASVSDGDELPLPSLQASMSHRTAILGDYNDQDYEKVVRDLATRLWVRKWPCLSHHGVDHLGYETAVFTAMANAWIGFNELGHVFEDGDFGTIALYLDKKGPHGSFQLFKASDQAVHDFDGETASWQTAEIVKGSNTSRRKGSWYDRLGELTGIGVREFHYA